MEQVLGEPHHARRVVEHDQARRSEQRARLLHAVEARLRVQLIGQQDRDRGPAGNDRLDRPPVAGAARLPLDELAQRHLHRRLVHPGPLHVAADAVELGTAVLFRTETGEPLGAVEQHERHVAEGLDVVDRGRAVVQADDGGKRRFVAGLRPLALERLEQGGLFSGLVGAGAAVHVDVAVETGPQHVPAEKSPRVGVVNRPLENVLDVQELTADVDVGDRRADGVAADRAPLDQEMRIALHQQMILERPRLAFVGVAGDVLGVGRLLVDELPFHPGRKAGAAPAAQPGRLDEIDDRLGREHERLAQSLVSLMLQVEVEREGVGFAHVLCQQRFHISQSRRSTQSSQSSLRKSMALRCQRSLR
jgi:hypothetical protein